MPHQAPRDRDLRAEFIPKRIEEWAYWIEERENIRRRREARKLAPWTKDAALACTRYCNVCRMDDKVSQWLINNWYSGQCNMRDRLLSALMARMINRPETLAYINKDEPYDGWKYGQFYKRMYEVKASGESVFTNAYIINGASGGPKIDQVLNAISLAAERTKGDAKAERYVVPESMEQTALRLHELPGVGSFIAGQVVADLRHVIDGTKRVGGNWQDRMLWAPVGPGSNRGMRYLLGVYNAADLAGRGGEMPQKVFTIKLQELVALAQRHTVVSTIFADRKLEAHDIQNTLCELGKYIRVRNGGHGKNGFDQKAAYRRDCERNLL